MTDVLAGVRVLEVAEQGFVPSGAAVLADWGADVVKVERPEGDGLRAVMKQGLVANTGDFDFLVEQVNRSKRNVCLDLKHPDSRPVLERLVAWADVFITNQLPQVRRKLRIEPADLFAINPRLDLCARTRPGHEGSRRRGGWLRRGVVLVARGRGPHALGCHGRGDAAPRAGRHPVRDVPRGGDRGGALRARARRPRPHRRRRAARGRRLDARARSRRGVGARRRSAQAGRHRSALVRNVDGARGHLSHRRRARAPAEHARDGQVLARLVRGDGPVRSGGRRLRSRPTRGARRAWRRSASASRARSRRSRSRTGGARLRGSGLHLLVVRDTDRGSERPAGGRERLPAAPPDPSHRAARREPGAVRRDAARRSAAPRRARASTPTRCSRRSASTRPTRAKLRAAGAIA